MLPYNGMIEIQINQIVMVSKYKSPNKEILKHFKRSFTLIQRHLVTCPLYNIEFQAFTVGSDESSMLVVDGPRGSTAQLVQVHSLYVFQSICEGDNIIPISTGYIDFQAFLKKFRYRCIAAFGVYFIFLENSHITDTEYFIGLQGLKDILILLIIHILLHAFIIGAPLPSFQLPLPIHPRPPIKMTLPHTNLIHQRQLPRPLPPIALSIYIILINPIQHILIPLIEITTASRFRITLT